MKVYLVFRCYEFGDLFLCAFKKEEDADKFVEESGGYGALTERHITKEVEVIE
jgi:hypothetical protein